MSSIDLYINTALQKHYADLQAVALERTTRDEPIDYVQPDTEGMAREGVIGGGNGDKRDQRDKRGEYYE